jgi:DNA (cytosine-5)-methyltransferase 1
MNVLDLFSGIGGFSLGLERAGMRTVGFCEIDEFCQQWLAQQWPNVPCYSDVRTLAMQPGTVDLVAGGFPCQDISVAGRGEGIDGERSGLWREMHRIIGECRPRWVVAENVPALRTRGADRVLGDLEGIGYTCWSFVVGADDIGAPHRRKRVWIVAYSNGERCKFVGRDGLFHSEREASRHYIDRCDGAELGDSDSARRQGSRRQEQAMGEPFEGRVGLVGLAADSALRWPAKRGQEQFDWEPPRIQSCAELVLGGDFNGLPVNVGNSHNRARLRVLGNSIVPQIAEAIGSAIMKIEQSICMKGNYGS